MLERLMPDLPSSLSPEDIAVIIIFIPQILGLGHKQILLSFLNTLEEKI